MGCSTGGCGSSAEGSGSCNKMNTYDWFSDIPMLAGTEYDIVEISFKNGARKDYFRNSEHLDLYKGNMVVVQSELGFDIGEVSLSGELVKMQMRKKKVKDDDSILKLLRKASTDELEALNELRAKEQETMITARVISRDLDLDMKVGDVEYQADGKKVTFYYTSEARVDFRDLVKRYVAAFKIKIEMRQIGARQEAQRLGGLGSCGRELCCSSFLNEFKSVTTGAARYQQLSINSDKLSGQCGRLKCCLNYELDTYTEALKKIPKKVDKLKTKEGVAFLRKTDIFKMEMTFNIDKTSTYYKISVDDVKKVLALNKAGEMPETLANFNIVDEPKVKEENNYDDLVGQVNLTSLTTKKKSNKRKKPKNKSLTEMKADTEVKTQKAESKPHPKQGNTANKPQAKKQNTANKPVAKQQTEATDATSTEEIRPVKKKKKWKPKPKRDNSGGSAPAQ